MNRLKSFDTSSDSTVTELKFDQVESMLCNDTI